MKKKLSSVFLAMAMMLVFCCSLPSRAAADEGSMVFITKPANGDTAYVGEEVPVNCTMTLPDDWDAKTLAQLYRQITIQVLEGNTVISTDIINVGTVDFTPKGREYHAVRFTKAGTYTLRVCCIGYPGVWHSVKVNVVPPGTDTNTGSNTGGYPVASDPRSSMNAYEIPGSYSEANNPGHHLRLGTNQVTIDLSKNKVGRFTFKTETEATEFVFYVDWPEDQAKKIIKFHAIGDDWIEYEGVSVGTTRLHTYIAVDGARYDHQVVTFNVIDSSKTASSGSTAKPGTSTGTSTGGTTTKPGTGQTASDNTKLKPGTTVKLTSVNGVYKVNSDGKTVTFTKPVNKNKTTVTIPATVTVNGKVCNVTEIASKAFKSNKKLKKITIGKNVVKIGSQAFYNCKNLKKITIQTSLLTSKTVGSKAFKGTPNKPTVTVPKALLKSYKTLLKSKGISKKAGYKKF